MPIQPLSTGEGSIHGNSGNISVFVTSNILEILNDNFVTIADSLGAASAAGAKGSQTITPEVPGDLGTRYLDLNTYLLLQESLRKSSTLNGIRPLNHRFRGHRESYKFLLPIQRFITICGSSYLALDTWNTALRTQETVDMYPTEEEMQAYLHSLEQIRFKEWLLLRDSDRRWFI